MMLDKKANAVYGVIIILVSLFVGLLLYAKYMPAVMPFLDTFAASDADPWDIFLMSILPFLILIAVILVAVFRK